MKVVSKLLLTIETDIETGDITLLNREVINDDIKTTKKSSSRKKSKEIIEDINTEPTVTLDSNKLILTQSAIDLLQVCEDCRIDIKYDKKDKKTIPVIGTDKAFGTKAGNLLSKKNTVSYRGAANTKLSAYGTVFSLEPTNNEGIYYLIGNANQPEIEIPDELINIENELDLENLETFDDSKELGDIDYTL